MTIIEAIESRHSVRQYTEQDITGEVLEQLQQVIVECNQESGLHIQLCLDKGEAFAGMLARYGHFENVQNYISLTGKKGPELEELCGYYGEKIVIRAAQLGLNTCWVAGSYKKGRSAAEVKPGEKELMVISIGYGVNQGTPHKSKPLEKLYKAEGNVPEWFLNGVKAAQLAPTAINQQKFCFELQGNDVRATAGLGFYTKTDLGIAKYHFEAGAGAGSWRFV